MAESNPTNWESKYQSGDTPWNKGEPSPGLVDFLNEHPTVPPGTVLLPGCGLGHDARAFAQRNFRAIGYDIAPSAVRLAAAMTPNGMAAEFREGDFLFDQPFVQFDWIFEHTCFCAIDPMYREEYVNATLRWLKPGGQLLAVHYLIPGTDGPPFGTTREEIIARFSPHYTRVDDWVPRSYPNRNGLERMFWWQRK